jgi:hypothetical protein
MLHEYAAALSATRLPNRGRRLTNVRKILDTTHASSKAPSHIIVFDIPTPSLVISTCVRLPTPRVGFVGPYDFNRRFDQGGPVAAVNQLNRGFMADRAVGSLLVVVSTPNLAFLPSVVEAREPVFVIRRRTCR